MIVFGVLLAAITGMAKVELWSERHWLVLTLAGWMLLFIYVLK
jgi:hypothetical protein